jgi:hypothetical protein
VAECVGVDQAYDLKDWPECSTLHGIKRSAESNRPRAELLFNSLINGLSLRLRHVLNEFRRGVKVTSEPRRVWRTRAFFLRFFNKHLCTLRRNNFELGSLPSGLNHAIYDSVFVIAQGCD